MLTAKERKVAATAAQKWPKGRDGTIWALTKTGRKISFGRPLKNAAIL